MNAEVEAKDLSNILVETCLNVANLFPNGITICMHTLYGEAVQGQSCLIAGFNQRLYHDSDTGAVNTVNFSSYTTLHAEWNSGWVKIITEDTMRFFSVEFDPETELWSAQETDRNYQPLLKTT